MSRPADRRPPPGLRRTGRQGRQDDLSAAAARAAKAAAAFAASTARTVNLVARRRLRHPPHRRNQEIRFGDGTRSRVYRHTTVIGGTDQQPVLLVMAFRLRGVGLNPFLHTLFRAESLANTPLFAGFPGFRSKLWLTDPRTGTYHGVYRWDGAERATGYAETMSSLLRLVSVPGSVRFHVEAGTTPDQLLDAPPAPQSGITPAGAAPAAAGRWWWPRSNVVTADGR